ncbi:ABC transporter ATP-binding protein [Haloarcula argentinensis]|uniref:ABC transporter ATP-binding protein n=1 Tax=Haloarcula argentinensis TaxID=43776 RepID=A0ABU2F1J8_HALAR|nr:ABC transporter ATP-binding protein [Haloarcula argentinensis]EMA19078.1 ABC transporter ATP-binding protein [Haloarcula argentinensis DSM 12282]MDS0254433.1 ABC transporter ATP-binding protein [Haloarcula argentinensis]
MTEPAIRASGLQKRYGDVQALDDLDLTVDQGEFFGLLGPNGAGKTTFINTLVGLVHKDRGTAEVFGFDVEDDYREARDRIGVAPQEFNVDRFFPIIEVLEHKAGYHGIGRAEARERAEDALKTVGIWDKRDTRFDWLSGGMKRRFVLARALVSDPDLLILDEPTAGVDVQLRHDLWEIINRMNDAGTTILLTTHYIEEAERLCDRVAIMDDGQKVEVAAPDDLMARGTDTIVLGLAEMPRTTPRLDVEGVTDVELTDEGLAVTAMGGSQTAPSIMRELEAQGHTVTSLDIRRASLEEVFVDMTRDDREYAEVSA